MKLHKIPTRPHKAFTLMEILIVIGILAMLMAVLVIALKKPGAVAKVKQTEVTMGMIKSAMDEMRRAGALEKLAAAPLKEFQGKILEKMVWAVPNTESTPLLNNTGLAVKTLQTIPANKNNISQLSKDRFGLAPNGNLIFLDGWNNPILFIPRTGFPIPSGQVVTSVGMVNSGNVPPNAKAFWMSAGPDADFSTTQDNLYSFQQ